MSTKYNGMQKASDWQGQYIKTTRDLSNSLGRIPAGSLAKVTTVSRGKLAITSDPCGCCGVQLHMTGLTYFDVELAENQKSP